MPYKEIKIEQIIFEPDVQSYCNTKDYKCPNYNHSWACPPVSPYLEYEVAKYSRFYLIYYKFNLNAYINKYQKKNSSKNNKEILYSLYSQYIIRDHLEEEILNFLKEYKAIYKEKLILWDGFCRKCYKEKLSCTYDKKMPCRYNLRYSMEAVGINVDKTVRNIGINIEWPPIENVYRFGLVCFK